MIARMLTVLLLACGCFAQSAPSAQPVLDADRAFNKATQEQRLEGWMSFMADNVVLFNLDAPVVGRDAVRKFYEPNFANPDFGLTWEPKTAEMQPSGKVGYTSGRYTLKLKSAKGDHGRAARQLPDRLGQAEGRKLEGHC